MSDEGFDFIDELFAEEDSKKEPEQQKLPDQPDESQPVEQSTQETQEPDTPEPESVTQESKELDESEKDEEDILSEFISDEPDTPDTTSQTQPSEPKETKHDEIFIESEPKEYDLLPDRGTAKVVVTIVARKGHGKTDVALSFPGKIAAISFDYKTAPVAEKRYPDRYTRIDHISSPDELIKYVSTNSNKDWIIVWDGKKYFDESSPETMLASSEHSMNYLLKVLDLIGKLKPDWVLIDGIHIFHFIAEMLMRYRNGLRPFQGIRDRNLWKERRMYLRQLHKAAVNACQKGVIYTTYLGEVDLTIVEGEIVNRDELPNWIDVVHDETDTVIISRQRWIDGVRKFVAVVESNKRSILPFKEGVEVDVTNKKAYDELIGGDGK